MTSKLDIKGLTGGYGAGTVLHGLDLVVHTGDVSVVLGPNGAGKTSLLRAISGTLPRIHGSIEFDGVSLGPRTAAKRASLGITHVPQGRGTFSNISVMDNLAIGAHLRTDHRAVKSDIDYVYETFPILAERRTQQAGLLSGGEQQMLALGRAFASRPKLLILDEPSLGLSPLMVKTVYEALGNYREMTDLGIVLVEQSAAVALRFATQVQLLETGRFVFSGSPDAVAKDQIIADTYLGRGKNA